ncbi:MAG: helix-turn-helix transcriptional regulator [Rhodospirillaceae bacterium]|nr:helix-turn-helix transcriptional regulator [Rhodospirillaceae bacterium]
MTKKKFIPAKRVIAKWRKDPAFVRAYNALEDEFALAATMIAARGQAGLTQQQLARKMATTQAVIARWESGRVKPSTRTLEKLALATGTRLRITLERPRPALARPSTRAA